MSIKIKCRKKIRMYKGTIFILKIYIMKQTVSNFNIKIKDLFKDPQD